MKTLMSIFMLGALTLAGQDPPPRQENQPGPSRQEMAKRRDTLRKLRDHLNTAIANAKLTDEQRQKMEAARAALAPMAQRKRRAAGQPPDRQAMRKAMMDLREVLQSGAFREEDRALIQNDLKELRKQGLRAGKRQRGQ